MPGPVAHMAVGLSSYILFKREQDRSRKDSFRLIITCLALSILPDFDFIPGIIANDVNKFHHGISHTLVSSVFIGELSFLILLKIELNINKYRLMVSCLCASVSHPLLDYFSADYSLPYGVPLFWPLSADYYTSPVSLFGSIEKGGKDFTSFVCSLINWNNLRSLAVELFFVLIILSVVIGIRKWQKG